MDNKFYVSLEAARLLKEKGYDGDAEYAYHENGNFSHWGRNVNDIDYLYAAPTKAEAIDWLESKGKVVELRCDNDDYDNDALHKDDLEWEYYIYQYDNEGRLYETVSGWVTGIYDTRLEAEDAAIIKACELL